MAGKETMVVVVGTYESVTVCLSFNPQAPNENGLQKMCQCRDHSGSVKAVATQHQWLATGSTDETIRLYDMSNYSEIGSLLRHEGSVTWITFRGDCMFTAGEDGAIIVWQTGTWNCLNTLTGHKGPVNCVAVHPTGKLALSVGRDRVLRTWNLSTGFSVFRQKLKEAARLVEWSGSTERYAVSYNTTIEVYAIESGVLLANIAVRHTITSILFVQEDVIAVASDIPVIQMFSIPSGECSAKLKGHTHRVKGLAIDPDCNFLFSASSDGSVRVWKLVQPLNESVCVSVCETGARLTCIALACPTLAKPTHNSASTVSEQSGATSGNTSSTLAHKTRLKRRPKLMRSRKRRRSRSNGLPFSHRKLSQVWRQLPVTKRKRTRTTP